MGMNPNQSERIGIRLESWEFRKIELFEKQDFLNHHWLVIKNLENGGNRFEKSPVYQGYQLTRFFEWTYDIEGFQLDTVGITARCHLI